MIKKTLARTDTWTSRESVFAHFRNKKVFSLMSDKVLWDYVISVTSHMDNGSVSLNYSKEWEAQIFMTVTNPWKDLKQLGKPYIAIKGETSDTIFPQVWEQWKQLNGTGKLVEFKGCGHLVPFEKPKELALEILNYLEGSDLIKE